MTPYHSRHLTERLRQLFGGRFDGLAQHLEEPARVHFGGGNNLLDEEEIGDLSLELQHLIAAQFGSADPFSCDSPEHEALQSFFINLARRVLARGGEIESLVRYTQTVQHKLIAGMEQINEIDFTRSRSVLAFVSTLFTELLLSIFRAYLGQKESTIQAQEEELRETSTPITEIWKGVLTLPIIGTLDSNRTLVVMDSLLNRIAQQHTQVVVMDLTGAGSVDSLVAHHLIQMVRAVQLMGAEAVLTGIRPEIARSLTHLELDLGGVRTRASLADGLKDAFRHIGVEVVPLRGGARHGREDRYRGRGRDERADDER
ncbi:hypothetical protein CKO15_08920 [Halorhodospira abdelmalekii]|uniref:STAS domain-containing protein n=1 Tax=Halorhodospira abdelmalekii TaxID=421629 RepID=UPI001907D588|nr:STAS domain-containing protein [Halorhodospira abdelmalekii]MBK1735403.1 hypothetical protein [Halorhodospira abdelmalekii]